jgi:hypothetical protein
LLHLARETAGAARTRSSLRPLVSEGHDFEHNSGAICAAIMQIHVRAMTSGGCLKSESSTRSKTLVMPGLDPGIHQSSLQILVEEDGSPGQAR